MDILCSHDLWQTLVKGNSVFKVKQFLIANSLFGILERDFYARYKHYKDLLDEAVELTGLHYDRTKILAKIFEVPVTDRRIKEYIDLSDELFLENPPIVINRPIDSNKSIIISNTVMVYGSTIREFIKREFGSKLASRSYFSDEMGVSKPNWKYILGSMPTYHHPEFHIGDNLITDGFCEKAGIKFVPIDKYKSFKESMSLL